jgi:hypothetical protein
MRAQLAVVALSMLLCSQVSAIDLTLQVPASELDFTERSAFSADGRQFVIGVRPEGRSDAGAWLVEVRPGEGRPIVQNLVAGTLEGTQDGRIGGAPLGAACIFSGMQAQGSRIYAGCHDLLGLHAALLEVDLERGSVRAGQITSCNAEPSVSPCEPTLIYPNGMGIDDAGRIYVTNSLAHLSLQGDLPSISVEGSGSITQITIDRDASAGRDLVFEHRVWFSADIAQDGLSPNGVQIEDNVLYYAAGPNINRVDITANGDAGAARVHYVGPTLSYIDDFAVLGGRMLLARTLPPALVALDRAEPFGTARELATRDLDLSAIPSSVSYGADSATGVVTCFFGGGIYAVSSIAP